MRNNCKKRPDRDVAKKYQIWPARAFPAQPSAHILPRPDFAFSSAARNRARRQQEESVSTSTRSRVGFAILTAGLIALTTAFVVSAGKSLEAQNATAPANGVITGVVRSDKGPGGRRLGDCGNRGPADAISSRSSSPTIRAVSCCRSCRTRPTASGCAATASSIRQRSKGSRPATRARRSPRRSRRRRRSREGLSRQLLAVAAAAAGEERVPGHRRRRAATASPALKEQGQWINNIKSQCNFCHQLGNQITRSLGHSWRTWGSRRPRRRGSIARSSACAAATWPVQFALCGSGRREGIRRLDQPHRERRGAAGAAAAAGRRAQRRRHAVGLGHRPLVHARRDLDRQERPDGERRRPRVRGVGGPRHAQSSSTRSRTRPTRSTIPTRDDPREKVPRASRRRDAVATSGARGTCGAS